MACSPKSFILTLNYTLNCSEGLCFADLVQGAAPPLPRLKGQRRAPSRIYLTEKGKRHMKVSGWWEGRE